MGLGGWIVDSGASHYEWFNLKDDSLDLTALGDISHQGYDVVLVSNTDFNKRKYPYYPSLASRPVNRIIVAEEIANTPRYTQSEAPSTGEPQPTLSKAKVAQPDQGKTKKSKSDDDSPRALLPKAAQNKARKRAKQRNNKKAKIQAVSVDEHFKVKQIDGLHKVWNRPEANKILLIDIDNISASGEAIAKNIRLFTYLAEGSDHAFLIGQTKNTQRVQDLLSDSKITIRSVGLGRDMADHALLTAATQASVGIDHYVVISNDHIFRKLPKSGSVTVLSPTILAISKELVLRADGLFNLQAMAIHDIPESLSA